MSFYSRPAIAFGQLMNAVTRSLTDGQPVSTALAIVRDHFQAADAELVVTRRGQEPTAYRSVADDIPESVDDDGEYTCRMAQTQETSGDVDYTMRLFFGPDAAAFERDEEDLLGVVLNQIVRALELASRIDTHAVERALYSDALDKLNVGVITVDAAGKIVSSSPVAERFLRARDGLQIQSGKLRAMLGTEDKELQASIRLASQRRPSGEAGPSKGLALTKLSGSRTLGIMIRPVPSSSGSSNAVAIYVRDCDSVPEVESEFVRQIFDLTPAEAAVTRRLTAGLSLEDAAHSLEISRNTARAHLRSIFSKSGITRQTELVRLVLSSAVVLGERPAQVA
ncbi:helix-turn-helix transcriptional regulator [uncultured Alsobacter sp.]|uniref:helix-turn-helix transcriptional regulator n=1 Tax=uncultured Alsobacter sp. TaxID=1748258 RepID=UPI0025EE4832|nr:helix-turn-helix transcriptional regulator [uncultured Alsobacter sp.]